MVPYFPLMVGVVQAIVILVVGVIVARWAGGTASRLLVARKAEEALSNFIGSLVRYMVLAMAVIAALAAVGIETTSFVALLASAGLAVGLALQGSLQHFAAGVMLLIFRPIGIGDFVEVAGQTGTVHDIGLFATVLHTPDNHTVTIPNGAITSGSITNYTTLGTRRGGVNIGVAYGADMKKVIEVLEAAAKSADLVLEDPAPAIAFVEFGASSLNFTVLVWAKTPDYLGMLHNVRVAVYDALNDAGIEIPFDQIVLHQADAAAAE